GTVTFDTAGTAKIAATVTYEGNSITTGTVSVTVTEDPVTLTTLELTCSVEEAEKGDTATLTVIAKDQNGEPVTDAEISCEGTNCTVEDMTVTFDQGGVATITATASRKGVTVTGQVEITVHSSVTLSDGTTVDLTDLSQTVTNSTYGWSVSLPALLTADSDNTEETVLYSSELLGFSVTMTVADLDEGDTATLKERYTARLEELEALIESIKADNETLPESLQAAVPTILSASYSETAGTYAITWQQGDTVTSEHFYLGSASTAGVTAVWDVETLPSGSELLDYILDTYSPGDLDKTHT
ncbi:MAG: Ig-like domain-containing protein, partial [Oscillospiraceae bacterium]|nr:Ig-like domain-containing protein [Oscillospiraceae bacterium]